jgi:hypothetical protein
VPHILIVFQVVQQIGDGTLADIIIPARKLTQDANLAVLAEPGCRLGEALAADCGARAGLGCAGRVAVEVLVHLVDELVGGVDQVRQVVVVACPVPGAGPGVAFDEDVLRGGDVADGVDGGLVEVQNEGLVHAVVFVVWICLVWIPI